MIAHFKRLDCRRNHLKSHGINVNSRYVILDEGILVESAYKEMLPEFSHKFNKFYSARELNFGWSYDVGMVGVLLSVTTSIMWILLAKILRYSPIAVQLWKYTINLNIPQCRSCCFFFKFSQWICLLFWNNLPINKKFDSISLHSSRLILRKQKFIVNRSLHSQYIRIFQALPTSKFFKERKQRYNSKILVQYKTT